MPGRIANSEVQSINAARVAIERGDFAAACHLLSDIDNAEARYLLGAARQYSGELTAAESAYQRAVELQPGLTHASAALGRMLIDQERYQDAAPVYEQLLQITPDSVAARYNNATVQLGLGECEAAENTFDTLICEGSDRPEVRFMRGRARLELGKTLEALDDLKHAHACQPTPYTLRTLASTYWMCGDHQNFETLVTRSLQSPKLVAKAADLIRQSGQADRARSALEAARSKRTLDVDSFAVLTQAYLDLTDADAAAKVAREGLRIDPHNRSMKASLASALLMLGNAQQMLEVVMPMRALEPNGQHWIAYEATALRMLGDTEYERLVDLDRFVRKFDLPVPSGFESIDDFNKAFLRSIDRLQNYNHEPLNQTLRSGSQTSRDLTSIDDPVVCAYIDALDAPIREYMREVGNDSTHPLTLRNTGEYRIAGSWSVNLRGGGRHINHVHPEGWISSAYYVSVPDDVEDETSKAGWIKFGEPPFSTAPATPPQKWVKPAAGKLVLFPSFLWHGTAAIHDDSTRVTAAFDVVPA